ncbi:MAG TPA: dienelactone hydrolase family protein [Candidatus Limnocylindria bacterium]|nr:dienelactone hydrolase family protein [Candidatus Limnocylindria bacterium]
MRRPLFVAILIAASAGLSVHPAVIKNSIAAKAPAGPDTARVHVGPAQGGTDAFVVWPVGKNPGPAVIVVHEWWGLNGQIRSTARRLAEQGYVAIVPDLYRGKVTSDPEQAHELLRGLDDERALADLDAAVAWLRAQPRVGKNRIGVVGFCAGGRLAQLMGLHSGEVAAVVVFYGTPETAPARLAKMRAPLQGHFGSEDQGIPANRVEELKAGLAKAGKSVDVNLYAGAGHAFMNDSRPSYHPDAARQAWARTLAFFQKHIKS